MKCHVCSKTDTEETCCTCFVCSGCSEKTLDENCHSNQIDDGMYCKNCHEGGTMKRPVYRCVECNGSEVQIPMWVSINERKGAYVIPVDDYHDDGTAYCDTCDERTTVEASDE